MNAAENAGSDLYRAIAELDLDSENPRFGIERVEGVATQEQLVLYMAEHYDALQIAESIAINGYFPSEPLIAVEERGRLVVVEGNRRLAALKLLSDPELRAKAAGLNPKWRRLVARSAVAEVPVVVVGSRQAVAPLLGFRHVTGLKKWESAAQARFIAAQIDDEGRDFEEVANEIGLEPADVRELYRDTLILQQAEDEFGLDVSGARQAFGVWTNAIARRGVRTYVGAPQPRSVSVDDWPIPADKRTELANVLSLVFGGPDDEDAVISDSRQLGDLSRVLEKGSAATVAALIESRDLASAVEELDLDAMSLERATAKLARSLSTYRDRHSASVPASTLVAIDVLLEALSVSPPLAPSPTSTSDNEA